MGRVAVVVILVGLAIYALVEVAQADSDRVRMFPRWLWAVCVVAVPVLGPLAWFVYGKPTRPLPPSRRQPSRPRAPDDDPDFLKGL